MGWAALIMGLSVLISRFMGLIRDKVISYLFGATQESDLYFAAFIVPDFINYLLAGAYFSITLMPLLSAYFEKDEEDAWRFFSSAVLWIALAITLLTGVAEVFADSLARLAAPGLPHPAHERLAFFLRIILPAQIFFLLGACVNAILFLRRQFFVPALAPLVYNLMIILGGILFQHRGMEGFCWGVLFGSMVGNFLLPLLAAGYGEGLRLSFCPVHPGLKRFFALALPLMLGQSVVVLDEQLLRIFGSLCGPGAISWLNYARRIMLVPVGVVAQAAGVASYPFLTSLAAKGDVHGFHSTINTALRNSLTLLIPLSVWMFTVAEPTVTLIFQQGHFEAADTAPTATALRIMLVVVFCWGYQQILGRGFYARQDTVTPAVIGTVVTVLSLPLYFLLARQLSTAGVAAASALSVAVYAGAISWRWRRRFSGEALRGLGQDIVRLTAVSLGAAAPVVLAQQFPLFDPYRHPYLESAWNILLSGFLFLSTFLLLARRLAAELIRPFLEKAGAPGRFLMR